MHGKKRSRPASGRAEPLGGKLGVIRGCFQMAFKILAKGMKTLGLHQKRPSARIFYHLETGCLHKIDLRSSLGAKDRSHLRRPRLSNQAGRTFSRQLGL